MPETPNVQLEMSPKTAKILAWVAWALVLLGTLSGAVAAFAWVSAGWQQAASGVSVLALLAAAEIRRQLPSARAIKAGPIAGAGMVVAIMFLAACNPYKAAWTTMDGVLKARDISAVKLAELGRAEHDRCLKAYGTKTQGYATCIKPWLTALLNWTRYGRPGLTSPVRVTATAVDIAKAKGNKKLDWKKVLAPISCALSGVGSDWSIHIPDELKLLKAAIQGLGAFTCPKRKAGWTDWLAPFGDLIKWLAKTLGEPTEAIRKRVMEVLAEPLSDGTDGVLATINATLPAR